MKDLLLKATVIPSGVYDGERFRFSVCFNFLSGHRNNPINRRNNWVFPQFSRYFLDLSIFDLELIEGKFGNRKKKIPLKEANFYREFDNDYREKLWNALFIDSTSVKKYFHENFKEDFEPDRNIPDVENLLSSSDRDKAINDISKSIVDGNTSSEVMKSALKEKKKLHLDFLESALRHHRHSEISELTAVDLDETGSWDFFELFSELSNYPNLLRGLGLIQEFEIDKDLILSGEFQLDKSLISLSNDRVIDEFEYRFDPTQCDYFDELDYFGPYRLQHCSPEDPSNCNFKYELFKIGDHQFNFSNELSLIKDLEASADSNNFPDTVTTGITLEITDFFRRLQNKDTRADDFVSADVMTIGVRVGVIDEDNEVYSLCERKGVYKFSNINDDDTAYNLVIADDEGWINVDNAMEVLDEVGDVKYQVHNKIMTFTGAPLCVSTPYQKQLEQPSLGGLKTKTTLEHLASCIKTQFVPRPTETSQHFNKKLRFGRTYRFFIAPVHMNGNSTSFYGDNTFSVKKVMSRGLADDFISDPVTFQRMESIPAPMMILTEPLSTGEGNEKKVIPGKEGESITNMVIRNQDLSEERQRRTTTEVSSRYLVPKKVSAQFAEWSGKFDDVIPEVSYGWIKKYHNGELPDDSYSELNELPYFPDPIVKEFEVTILSPLNRRVIDTIRLPLYTATHQWPEYIPWKMVLRDHSISTCDHKVLEVEEESRVLYINLKKGEIFNASVESIVDLPDLEKSHWTQLTIPDMEERSKFLNTPIDNLDKSDQNKLESILERYDAKTEFKLTHAVIAPYTLSGFSVSDRNVVTRVPNSETDVHFEFETHLPDNDSIGIIELHSICQEQVDAAEANAGDPSIPINIYNRDYPQGVDKSRFISEQSFEIPLETETCDLKALIPAKDTKHRFKHFSVKAISRFKEYYQPYKFNDEDFEIWANIETEHSIKIDSNDKPQSVSLKDVTPLFRWESFQENGYNIKERFGNSFRIWLNRGWWSTGESEYLAIMLYNENASDQNYSAIGRDGISFHDNIKHEKLRKNHFINRIYELDEPDENAVFFTPKFDENENLWYCDIELELSLVISIYRPFIKLVLARFQPNSEVGKYYSDPLQPLEMIQLNQYRSVYSKLTQENSNLHIEWIVSRLKNGLTSAERKESKTIRESTVQKNKLLSLIQSKNSSEEIYSINKDSFIEVEFEKPNRMTLQVEEDKDYQLVTMEFEDFAKGVPIKEDHKNWIDDPSKFTVFIDQIDIPRKNINKE
jgi:hypothetical protein